MFVSLLYWALSAAVIAVALRRVNRDLGERQVPLMGVLAAAIFAGQMLNFTVAGGTSGHLLGAALATILVGPWAAVLVMTAVVSTQALIFQDGGLLALGANLFNMAILGVAVAYAVNLAFQKVSRGKTWGIFWGGFWAAWASILASALSCGLQLALSGTSPANIAIPAMAGIHALIGLGEGLITLGALAFLYTARRDLVAPRQAHPASRAADRGLALGGGLLALALAITSPLASQNPDGLEKVAEQHGFLSAAAHPLYRLIPDYTFPGLADKTAATIVAGILGILIVSAVAGGFALLRRGSNSRF